MSENVTEESLIERAEAPHASVSRQPLRLDDVSLVIADTVDPYRAIRALEHCRSLVTFRDAFLFTDTRVPVPDGVTYVPTARLSDIARYSEFMLWDLPTYRRLFAPHVLIVQHDGLILNPAAWDDEFLTYDYVGAPWIDGGVGNGGFSLRSQRLLETLPKVFRPGNGRAVHPEDLILCGACRSIVEELGIRFAPTELAGRFSVENAPYRGSFGYHGPNTEGMSGFSLDTLRPQRLSADAEMPSDSRLRQLFRVACETPSDINSHVQTLARLAHGCLHVTEFGTRTGTSTAGLLYGRPGELVTYDVDRKPGVDDLENAARAAGIPFRFIHADVLGPDVPKIAPTDLLFIDTYHVYEQAREELRRHAGRVRRFIVFHDTDTFGMHGEAPGSRGLVPAIEEFLRQNPSWHVAEHHNYNHGLTVLARASRADAK